MSRIVDVLHVPELGTDPASPLYQQFQNIINYFESEVMFVQHDPLHETVIIWFTPTYAAQINYAITQWANSLQNPYPACPCGGGGRGNTDEMRKNTAIFRYETQMYTGCFPILPKMIGDDGWVGFAFNYQYVGGISNLAYGM
jgi:hypothetical protein